MSTIDGHRVHEKNEKEPKPKEMGGCCAAEVCVFFFFVFNIALTKGQSALKLKHANMPSVYMSIS